MLRNLTPLALATLLWITGPTDSASSEETTHPVQQSNHQIRSHKQIQSNQVGPGWYFRCAPCENGWEVNPVPPRVAPRELPLASMPRPVPPSGTIGRTYQMISRPVPVEKHPRTGMLDVYINGAYEVIVHDMNSPRIEQNIEGFRDAEDENVWHFESNPLYPGLDHIYRVQATFKNDDGSDWTDARYVRLIMGRVVDLDF
ncbi:hypothetical protein AB1L42_07250 [Thalassoglobus sp. JC818]|uniref:hypothetical protein n=1 Tax=Thalassoglobus sp. JC818 TaxID=3232136 RepID=UPI0034589D00